MPNVAEFQSNFSAGSNGGDSSSGSASQGAGSSSSIMDVWNTQELAEVFRGSDDEMLVVRNTFFELCKMAEIGHPTHHNVHPDRFVSAPAMFGACASALFAVPTDNAEPATIPAVAKEPSPPVPVDAASFETSQSAPEIVTSAPSPSESLPLTTVMVRNIPTRISSQKFIEVVLSYRLPVTRLVDFLYLPIDFKTNKNLGYCFVNFRSPADATEFIDKFNEKKYIFCDTSEKKLQINFSNRQGYTKNLEVFTQTKMLDTWPSHYRPLAILNQESDALTAIDSAFLETVLATMTQ